MVLYNKNRPSTTHLCNVKQKVKIMKNSIKRSAGSLGFAAPLQIPSSCIKEDTSTMKIKSTILLLFLALFTLACSSSNVDETHTAHQPKEFTSKHKWNYIGESGPEYWAQLESESECDGHNQSPINIVDIETKQGVFLEHITELEFEDETTITSLTNNGHTIQYNFNGDLNTIKFENKEYKMKQFHFHSPSEHTINGVRYPLEIHLVHHCEETDAYVVFAMLVQQGVSDPTFDFLEQYLPVHVGETKPINSTYNLGYKVSDIFGMDSVDVYTYKGSLTTPPCTEDVLWIVMKNASSASASQIELLENLMPKNNYRNTQPINDRVISKETITELF